MNKPATLKPAEMTTVTPRPEDVAVKPRSLASILESHQTHKVGLITGFLGFPRRSNYHEVSQAIAQETKHQSSANLIVQSVDYGLFKDLLEQGYDSNVTEMLTGYIDQLERAGCKGVALLSSALHPFLPNSACYRQHSRFLHVGDSIGRAVAHAGVHRVGYIGPQVTMRAPLMMLRINQHADVFMPDIDYFEEIDKIIRRSTLENCSNTSDRQFVVDIIVELIQRHNLDGVILGCSTLSRTIIDTHTQLRIYHDFYNMNRCIQFFDAHALQIADIAHFCAHGYPKYANPVAADPQIVR